MQTKPETKAQRHGAVKDLITHINEKVHNLCKNHVNANMYDFLGNGSTPSNLNLTSTSSDADVAAVSRNLNHPLINVAGFTATAYWNNRQGQARHGTLITPQHIIACDHYNPTSPAGTYPLGSFVAGDKLAFKDNKNNTYFRTVIGVSDEILGGTVDREVSTLNEALPDSIQPMKLMPPDFLFYLEAEANLIEYTFVGNTDGTNVSSDPVPYVNQVQENFNIPQPFNGLVRNRYGQWSYRPHTKVFNLKTSLPGISASSGGDIVSASTAIEQTKRDFTVNFVSKVKSYFLSRFSSVLKDYRDVNEYEARPDLFSLIPSGSSGGPSIIVINNECVWVGSAGGGCTDHRLWGTEANDHYNLFGDTYSDTVKNQTILTAIVAADTTGGVSTGYKPESISLSNQFIKPKTNCGGGAGEIIADNNSLTSRPKIPNETLYP